MNKRNNEGDESLTDFGNKKSILGYMHSPCIVIQLKSGFTGPIELLKWVLTDWLVLP